MNVKDTFVELIKKYGWNLLSDTDRLSQMLESRHKGHEHEIFCITLVLRYLLQKMRRISPNVPYVTEEDKQRLTRIFSFTDEEATNAVDAVNAAIAATCPDGVTWFAETGRLHNVKTFAHRYDFKAFKKSLKGIFIVAILLTAFALIVFHAESLRRPKNGELTVAFMLPLSKEESNSSYLYLKSAQMAAEKANLQFQFQDNCHLKILGVHAPTNDETSIANTKRILQKSSALAIVAIGSTASKTISQIANQLEIPVFFTGQKIPKRKTLRFGSVPAPYTFMLSNDTEARGKALAYFARQGLKKRRIAIVTDENDDVALEIERSTHKWIRSFGGRTVAMCRLNLQETNTQQIIKELKSAKPSVIIVIGQDSQYRTITLIRADKSLDTPIIALDYDNVRATKMNLSDTWWLNETTDLDDSLVSFVPEIEAKYGKNTAQVNLIDSILAYDAVMFIAQMFDMTTSFRGESLRHTVMSMKYTPLMSGVFSMNPRTHSPLNKAFSIIRVEQSVPVFQRKLKLITR